MTKPGFTLIELMIVVAIIAILALIAVPQYKRYVERSRDSAVQTLLQQLLMAEIALQSDLEDADFALVNGQSPADLAALERLAAYGFRPDSRVGFVVLELNDPGGAAMGIIAYAAYSNAGARLFAYDNVIRQGVRAVPAGAAAFPATYAEKLYLFRMDAAGAAAPLGWLEVNDNQVLTVKP